MSDSVRPHRWQPTRLPHPWDSPGSNAGVGCHFLLQCIKVKSESEVAQSCPTLSHPMDSSLPGSSIHGIFQARVLEWGAIAFSRAILRSLRKTKCYIVLAKLSTLRWVFSWGFTWPEISDMVEGFGQDHILTTYTCFILSNDFFSESIELINYFLFHFVNYKWTLIDFEHWGDLSFLK